YFHVTGVQTCALPILKDQNCTVGYQKIIEFAREHNVPFDICGKLIVSTNAKENEVLGSIYDRGVANGLTELKMVSREEIKEIERSEERREGKERRPGE